MRNYARKRKIKRYVALVAIISLCAYGATIYFNKYKGNDYKIAEVNNVEITKNDISFKISEIFSVSSNDIGIPEISKLSSEAIETFAKEIYLEKKLVKKAKKAGLEDKPEIRIAVENAKNKILLDAYFDYEIQKNITEKKIKEKYLELTNKVAGKREFLIYHIVVDSEKRAKWIYRKYNETSPSQKPRKFAKLAKKYSIDKDSANNKGKLGYILEDNLIEEISKEIIDFKKPGYTKPIKTDFGWHVVVVKKIRDAEILPFEKSYEGLKNQIIKDTVSKIYQDISEDAKVKILIDLTAKEESKDQTEPNEQ